MSSPRQGRERRTPQLGVNMRNFSALLKSVFTAAHDATRGEAPRSASGERAGQQHSSLRSMHASPPNAGTACAPDIHVPTYTPSDRALVSRDPPARRIQGNGWMRHSASGAMVMLAPELIGWPFRRSSAAPELVAPPATPAPLCRGAPSKGGASGGLMSRVRCHIYPSGPEPPAARSVSPIPAPRAPEASKEQPAPNEMKSPPAAVRSCSSARGRFCFCASRIMADPASQATQASTSTPATTPSALRYLLLSCLHPIVHISRAFLARGSRARTSWVTFSLHSVSPHPCQFVTGERIGSDPDHIALNTTRVLRPSALHCDLLAAPHT
ncbi:hypothetical protein K458DRAFT_392028 [Lentithecium fluviatile CBS 122367]|uniref:Uncharacterized protein n=1 Tax=Lentithecium fluviatile CBS 122367 TaxID=1168545 RepID=A0A6G1ISK6_9PLEO|nr:hypothetical protein K458DRAFT_392028 [Lentithecium fluviatile CBS 122367]